MINIAAVSNHISLYIAYLNKEYPSLTNLEMILAAIYLYGYGAFKKGGMSGSLWSMYQDMFIYQGQYRYLSLGTMSSGQGAAKYVTVYLDKEMFNDNSTVFDKYLRILVMQLTCGLIQEEQMALKQSVNNEEIIKNVIGQSPIIQKYLTAGKFFINAFPEELDDNTIFSYVKGIRNNKEFLSSISQFAKQLKDCYKDKVYIDTIDSIRIY